MRKSQEIRTYEAVETSLSPFSSLSLAYRELYWSRHVIWHLFARDFEKNQKYDLYREQGGYAAY